ncbi:resistance to inhibitors of cholinesterase protein 3 isoform X11 [Zootermopsis nevadensis]|uniref:resistance to inhibitors of cholinesterase protein 3 isoform X11 n=1 Tax=Zootermopsis nevadensis TaxID=136037 RepID=UPI000B8EC8BE|nr:resistance to inhibitors of cholinesterase protein 3 isoform X11 [Zootermopsis nevadensis]
MAIEFGTGKTIFILAIVVGCFAVLWPKLFYPMLQASVSARNHIDNSQVSACCDVIFETDVNAIMIMTEMCGNILQHYDEIDPKLIQAFKQGKLTKAGSETCRNEVLNKCGVDITTFLHENVRLGKTYKQILDEIRSFNSSVCLKLNFGIAPGLLGAPHRMRVGAIHMPRHHRQERPPHLHPDMLHPALRERGRAIPQSHIIPRVVEKEGRPGPIPGMRPPMGGAGHVVPAPKGTGTMGVVMPIYTIGIVVFFMYTVMKVMAQLVVIFKKPGHSAVNYGDFSSDPDFRKMVFSEEYVDDHTNSYGDQSQQKVKHDVAPTRKTAEENGTKLGWKEHDTRDIEIDHLRKRLEETEAAMERIVAQMGSVPHKLHSSSGTQLIGAKGEDILNEKSRKTVSAGQMEALKKEVEPKEASQKSTISSDTTQKALRDEMAPEAPAIAEEGIDEDQDGRTDFQHVNDAGHVDDLPTTTNYTTASAAEAMGQEETAADYSAMESFGTNDDQQEELEDEEEEVWNGDVDSAEDESEEEEVPAQAFPQNVQQQH